MTNFLLPSAENTKNSHVLHFNNHNSGSKHYFYIVIKSGEVNLFTSSGGGESEKLKKGGGSMVHGLVFLKGVGGWGEGGAATFPISKFIVFIFRNYFSLCKIVLCF